MRRGGDSGNDENGRGVATGSLANGLVPEAWIDAHGGLLGADPALLRRFGHPPGTCPRSVEDLVPAAHPDHAAVHAALESPGNAARGGAEDWIAERFTTPTGTPGTRLRPVAACGAVEPLRVWGRGLSHLLRNQQMVLANSLYSLSSAMAAPLDDRARESCIQLARGGIERSLALLESFTHLTTPGDEGAAPTVAEVLGWFEVLFSPRARRSEAALTLDPSTSVGTRVDGGAAAMVLTATAEAVLPELSRGVSVVVELVRTQGAGHRVLAFHLVGGRPEAHERCADRLIGWGVGAEVSADAFLVSIPRAVEPAEEDR